MENPKNIDDFVKAVNSAINNNEDLKQALNKAVEEALPKDEVVDKTLKKKYFDNLEAFVNFLPNTIKNFFDNGENLGDLKSGWESFQIQDGDLEKLYKINLALKTKTNIIRKFNMFNRNNDGLSTKENTKKALSTFKKILNEDQVSVSVFYYFINCNINSGVLLGNDLDDIVDYVKSSDKNDKFKMWKFYFMCSKFKDQPSEKFINFMVKNTDFTKLNDEYLISNIITLLKKHPEYQGDKNKDNMVEALKDILCGNDPYKEFSEALAKVPDIEKKIKLDSIKKIMDKDVAAFARELRDNNIEIKFENNKFVVETKKHIEEEKPKKEVKIGNENEIKINDNKENKNEKENENNDNENESTTKNLVSKSIDNISEKEKIENGEENDNVGNNNNEDNNEKVNKSYNSDLKAMNPTSKKDIDDRKKSFNVGGKLSDTLEFKNFKEIEINKNKKMINNEIENKSSNNNNKQNDNNLDDNSKENNFEKEKSENVKVDNKVNNRLNDKSKNINDESTTNNLTSNLGGKSTR